MGGVGRHSTAPLFSGVIADIIVGVQGDGYRRPPAINVQRGEAMDIDTVFGVQLSPIFSAIAAVASVTTVALAVAARRRKRPIITCDVEPVPNQPGWHMIRFFVANHAEAPVLLKSVKITRPRRARILAEDRATIADGYGNFVPKPELPIEGLTRHVDINQTFRPIGGVNLSSAPNFSWTQLFVHCSPSGKSVERGVSFQLAATFSWKDRLSRRFRIMTQT